MGFNVFKMICELMMKEHCEEYIFARAFLILELNLMARSENVVDAHILHVHWEDDCLVFRFVKSKGDQIGRNRDQEWHVYANPHNPAICPVLALACYIFSNPGVFSVSEDEINNEQEDGEVEAQVGDGVGRPASCKGRLFPGDHQYDRFMGCLHRIIEKYPNEFFALGIRPGDLGSHSARKGASSHACAGTTVSPPIVSICLRAMWSLGHVKERYLQYEKAGDQYLGRVVSGLDVNDVSFAVSPPFFDFEPGDGFAEIIYSLMREYMVCGDRVPASVHHIFLFCFASLCFHFDYLAGVLHPMNKLQASHFFNNIPNYARDAATVKYPWNKTDATPTLTGLPPHITILANFEQLRLDMAAAREAILNGVEAELDRRRIGSQSHFDKEEILDRMNALHNELLKKVDICGRSSATALRNVRVADDNANEFLVGEADEDTPQPLTIVDGSASNSRTFQFFYSGGEISRLSKNFVFPDMTLCTLITSWFCGNPSLKTIPFKFLKQSEFKEEKTRRVFRKMKAMIDAVIVGAKKVDAWTPQSGTWEVRMALSLYESVCHLFQYRTNSIRRNEQLSWRTVYNLYLKKKKKFATDLDVEIEDEARTGDT